MVDSIVDLKNNRRKLVSDTSASYEPLLKLLRHQCDQRSRVMSEPLRVPFKDLVSADVKGTN